MIWDHVTLKTEVMMLFASQILITLVLYMYYTNKFK